jgi:hypothetical protein
VLGAVSVEVKSKLEGLLSLLQQNIAQLVDDSDPVKVIFKAIRGQVPTNVEEALFQATHLESRQLQYQLNVLPTELPKLNSRKRCYK